MMDSTDNTTPTPAGGKHHGHRKVIGAILRYGVPPVITVGLCLLLFRDMDPARMWHTIRTECDFRWIWANLALNLVAHVARAARWQIQLRALDIRPGLWPLTLSIFGTYAVNLVFPRLGEVWRTGYISERQRAPFTQVFGSMVAERLSDTVVVGTLSLVTFLVAGSQFTAYLGQFTSAGDRISDVVTSPLLWSALIALGAASVWMWRRFPDHRVFQTARKVWGGLWEGFSVIAAMPGKGLWLCYTAILWGSYFGALWCGFMSFPLTAQVIASHGLLALMCFVLTSLSMGVPSKGGIGPYQWAMVFGLGLYAVPGLTRDYATTFANLLMGVSTIGLIILGIFTFICIALSKRSA